MTPSTSEGNDKTVLERVLKIALPEIINPLRDLKKTTFRTFTRRGVIWLGQTCNLHCYFCYFIDKIHDPHHPEHPFMSLDKAKKICQILRNFYNNNSVDIQGGEPTIYKDIYKLIAYCNEIGLRPTLITNALVLDKLDICKRYKDAGIRDFLISIHGLGDVYDRIVGVSGAYIRQMKAINNLIKIGIPFRFNCVLSKPVIEQLPFIADFAIKTGVKIVNFIAFNPFEDQSKKGRRNITNVPKYSEIKEKLTTVIDRLEENNIEVNVRYLPICLLEERHRKSVYNFQQLSYDHHEWDLISWSWTGLQPQRTRDGDLSKPIMPVLSKTLPHVKKPLKKLAQIRGMNNILYNIYSSFSKFAYINNKGKKEKIYRRLAKVHAEIHCKYKYSKKCIECSVKEICDGFHGDYAEIFGTSEAKPIKENAKIIDPTYYIRFQEKYVEIEDESWALPD